jgi:hypothetical protein
MPSTLSAVGDLVIFESPATATTIARDPGRGFQVTAVPRVARQTTGR